MHFLNLISVFPSVASAENFAKNAVDFLFDLKPVIQESLHKAIRWKTWEQLSSVQGPLSLKQVCQVNSKGTLRRCDDEQTRFRYVLGMIDNNFVVVNFFRINQCNRSCENTSCYRWS